MKRLYFRIADLVIQLNSESEIVVTEDFEKFQEAKVDSDYEFCINEVERLPMPKTKLIDSNWKCDVYRESKDKLWYAFQKEKNEKYSVITKFQENKKEIEINYLESEKKRVTCTEDMFFYSCWESIFLRNNRLILHASFIRSAFGGILFVGPSGIGKSTQAKLWCDFARATLINGDRPIVTKVFDEWRGYGSPYAGSSRCCINENEKITAVFILKKGKENRLRRLGKAEAFRKIWHSRNLGCGWFSVCRLL